MTDDEEIIEQTEPTEPLRSGGDNNENEQEENDMPDTPNPLGKLPRSALLHYLATNFDFTQATPTAATSADWYIIGKDVEDMSVAMNADISVVKNILDESSVQDNGYAPSVDVDTYYANPTNGAIYTHLKDIMMNRKTGDACRTYLLEVLVDTDGSTHDAWVEEVIVKPTSYGGAPGGVRIPYTISFAGNRQKGTVTFSGKVPTFAVSA